MRKKLKSNSTAALLALLALFGIEHTRTAEVGITPMLFGIGFYEQSLAIGIDAVSFAGGAEVVFYGQGMSHTPTYINAIFTNNNLGGSILGGAPQAQDVAFSSHTDGGKLKYTTPSLMKIHDRTLEAFNTFEWITYDMSLVDYDTMTQQLRNIPCDYKVPQSYCRITFARIYTPILYHIQPPVVYYGSEVSFWVDPRSAQSKKSTTLPELPFLEVRLNEYAIDFEGFLEEDTVLATYSKNQVRGIMGAITPNASAAINFKFRVGQAQHQESTMIRCSYDNQTCYKAKAVAVIHSISAESGYTTGGQLITVNGHGFNSENIQVQIDGMPCAVQETKIDKFTCLTSPQPAPSSDTYYVGQHGLKRKWFNQSTEVTWTVLKTSTNFVESLALEMEAPRNLKDGFSGNVFSGYFKAPATAGYRFYVACDDACQIDFSKVNMDPSNSSLIYTTPSYQSYRNYFSVDGRRMTSWLNLTADEYYYMEVRHSQYTGGDDVSVAVEIEDQNAVQGHHHSMREQQRLFVNQVNVREKTNITITNPDGGDYALYFQNPKDSTNWGSPTMNTNQSGSDMYYNIRGFYSSVWNAPIDVQRYMYDENDTLIYNVLLSKKTVYTITVPKSIASASTNLISVSKVSTKSVFAVLLPKNYQLSVPPISGNFKIKCSLADGVWNTTLNILTTDNLWIIRDRVVLACPNYREKFEVIDGPTGYYYEDGRDLIFRFLNLNQDIPQMEVLNSDTNPLVGNEVTVNQTTWIPYSSQNLFYEPIPYEFLFTAETKPQVIVSVDGLEAVCASLACGYTYVAPTALITGYSISGSALIITGENFPSTIRSIILGNIPCTDIEVTSATSMTCTVIPVTGTWTPIVYDINGLIPLDPVATQDTFIDIPLVILSVVPNIDLNPFGGNHITITGENMPVSLTDGTEVSITFSDGGACDIEKVESGLIQCITEEFITGTVESTMTLTINGKSDSSQIVAVSEGPASITSITPSSVSPVIKSILTLQVDGLVNQLDMKDLLVTLVSVKNSSVVRYMNVIEVGNEVGNQYMKVKFGGSESGVYKVLVRSKLYGRFDATGITLTLIGQISEITPRQGSVHGGTLVTITGNHFSNDYTDNPVRIGHTDCMVEKSTPTEIQCRTVPSMEEVDGTDEVIVFLKTYEEAICNAEPNCMFTWVSSTLPSLTSYTTEFDATLQEYVLTLTGENFAATLTETQILIDRVEQTLISVGDTEIKVKIDSIDSGSTRNVKLYLPIGLPNGLEELTMNTGITVAPQFLGVSPQTGSSAGSLITATVKGLGPKSTGVSLYNSAGVNICETVSITAYGVVQCKTKALTLVDGELKVKVGTVESLCVGLSGECNYQTTTTMPQVSSVTQVDASTITLTGSGFTDTLASFLPIVTFGQVTASTVVADSDTQITATFNHGLPLALTATTPKLYFKSEDALSNTTHWAEVVGTLTNLVTVTATDNEVSCSFAGGCLLSLTQPGLLASLVSNSSNSIRVCGKTCKPSLADSTAEVTKCQLPALPTTYSIEEYTIVQESYLTGTPFSSNSLQTMLVWDGSHQNGWTSNTANCYFGTQFRVGYVGVLNEVKYFMSRFTKANFVGKLSFQGSQDQTTWTTVFTVGEEIHEGWNYRNYEPGQELVYRYYRFFGSATGSCIVGEVSLRGFEAIDNTADSYSSCQTQIVLAGVATPVTLTGTVNYQAALTPLLKAISPRFGTVVGGEEITFTGENFSLDETEYSILIDARECVVTSATLTEVKCITSKRPGLYEVSTLTMNIKSMGGVATQGLIFRYVNYWSEPLTWGGEFAPIEGDMVYVPKGLNLLVDVDSTPILSAVVVEGSLIFPANVDPEHVSTFDAHYVMVRGGTLEVGTEQFPYTSKLVITMHSSRQSPELPIFGNKVIAMYNGLLDLHGIPRVPTWTELDVTSDIGSSTITLIRSVDWKVGERIVIAPTGYYNTEAEERTIMDVDRTDPNKPVITIDSPLEFKHYAGIQIFGDDFIEMRAEVGLLTRNVLYRGDPETSAKNEYGAHIMVHSNGMETLTARIEYIEFFNVGQAFQLGRYPIHFHLIGAVHNSYIKGNAIHQSYNRACTIHGVHYLRVTENVAYNTKGHTFFIEDAAETKNVIEFNLAILTKKSWSLLNSDQTPASFWITHPDNIVRNNHAAGSDNYGFWYDTKPNPTGPSYDPNICPENSPLGEFANNVAHSNGRYGLRVFHKLKPRTYPCKDISDDPKNLTDRYWRNPLITSTFYNLTSFKNRRNGAIALDIADVRFVNFKLADNLLAGFEVELTNTVRDGLPQLNGALIIGRSDNADLLTNTTASHGVIGPRTENFQVHNVKFYNFDIADKAALSSCSHCFAAPSTDSGARTLKLSNLYFDSSVTVRIRYTEPWRDIFLDLDGSLTDLGPNSWTTPYFKHNDHKGCTLNMAVYDGLVCDNSIELRRLVFYNYVPNIFVMQDMKILPYDDSLISPMDNVTLAAYILNKDNYANIKWRPKNDPLASWAIPFMTGRKYKIHWGHGLDFTSMQMDLSPHWAPTDQDVKIMMNFTDIRAAYDFLTGGDNIKNETMLSTNLSSIQTGANVVYNDTPTRQLNYVVNGKNATRRNLVMKAYRCVGPCLPAVTAVAVEANARLWSNPASWTSGKVPLAGEDVVIEPGKNFIFDLSESPIYRYIQINGRVTFQQDATKLHLRAKYVFVRVGELIIGSSTQPFLGDAQITLFGEKENESIVYDNAIEAGNKILANTGLMQMYGIPRNSRSRLTQTVQKGGKTLNVAPGLGWKTNDTIGLASTTMNWFQNDYALIIAYDNMTGVVTLDKAINHYHWGALQSTGDQYSGVDMRGEVMLLNRNIRISGEDIEGWGCQVVTSDFVEGNGEFRRGRTYLDNVEIYNCSQMDTYKAALRFEGSQGSNSSVSNCSLHHGLGISVQIMLSAGITMSNNNIYDFVKYGVNIETSKNITLDGNWIFNIRSRHLSALMAGDPQAAIMGCANTVKDICEDLKIINNNVGAIEGSTVDVTGYSMPGNDCGDQKVIFKNNVAHSIIGYGAIIYKNFTSVAQDLCIEASYFTAYKCSVIGIVSNQLTDKIIFSNMILIDNGFSAVPAIGQEGKDQWAIMKDIKFYGETEARDCEIQNICILSWDTACFNKVAIMPSCFANHAKPAIITSPVSWPQYKIKADASLGGKTLYDNMQFFNFRSRKTWCGMDQTLFKLNQYAADYIPTTRLINSKFENVDWDAMAYLFTPPNEWTVVDDCGEFPCTGPLNALIKFEKTTYSGVIKLTRAEANFQIIAMNDENSGGFNNCTKVVKWNGYYCNNEQLAIISFESLDEDFQKRIFSPITITTMNLTARNVINTFMDHQWDGFYTSMIRTSRFVAILQGGENMYYDINYKGTPPQKQNFALRSDYTSVILRIKYPKAGAYVIKDINGVEIKQNAWDKTISAPAQIKSLYCGENRYIGVLNILEFYLPKSCQISIVPIDSIQTSVRLDWTISEFYGSGGTTQFQDRIAASLGIGIANVKIVSVYQGSVFVDFQIIDDSKKTVSNAGGIEKIQTQLTKKLTTGAISLGAKIMSVSVVTLKAAPTAVIDSTGSSSSTPTVINIPMTNTGTTTSTTTTTTIPSTPTVTIPVTKPRPVVAPIVQNNTIIVVNTEQESSGGNSTLMIAVICSIIGVIIFGGAIGYFVYRKYSLFKISQDGLKALEQSSKQSVSQVGSPDVLGDDIYAEQYHPEMDIFGKGDPFKKVNEADQIAEEEDDMGSNSSPGLDILTEGDEQMHTKQRDSKMREETPMNHRAMREQAANELPLRKNSTRQIVDEEIGNMEKEIASARFAN